METKKIRKQAEFTKVELKLLYAIVDEYGKNNKPELMGELKSLLRYDRMTMKNRITSALMGIL